MIERLPYAGPYVILAAFDELFGSVVAWVMIVALGNTVLYF